jgi:TonB family protein
MLPHPSSRSAPGANAPPPLPPPLPDLALLLEQHVVAGFPPDLALDLVLNELVARAADATHASAAALALLRGKQMVCRAATGLHAPDLGIPLDTRGGLSGACVRSREPQLCDDTESDPRIDPTVTRRLGIRSMLVVPVFDHKKTPTDRNPALTGVLEVFSPLPNTFAQQAQILLADFADECARIHNMAANLRTRPRTEAAPVDDDLILSDPDALKTDAVKNGPETTGSDLAGRDAGTGDRGTSGAGADAASSSAVQSALQGNTDVRSVLIDEELATQVSEPEILPSSAPAAHPRLSMPLRQPYEIWTLILGGLVILAAAAFSFMIGSRIGWLRSGQPASTLTSQSAPRGETEQPASSPTAKSSAHGKNSEKTSSSSQRDSSKSKPASHDNSPSSADELVVYDKGKVVFRMKPAVVAGQATSPPQPANKISAQDSAQAIAPSQSASSKTGIGSGPQSHTVWLAPAQAESRLVTRTEPQYPADALAAQRSGNVTLEVHVAEDGTVSSVRPLAGDPLLAAAAAQAVRNWRYQPYRSNDRPSPFQTDVTLTFSLPN